jgi:hypothetical protein
MRASMRSLRPPRWLMMPICVPRAWSLSSASIAVLSVSVSSVPKPSSSRSVSIGISTAR